MKLIKTMDTSRPGNDCYINETVSIVEQFGLYAIIHCQKIDGWAERHEISVTQTTNDPEIAEKMFNDYTDVFY